MKTKKHSKSLKRDSFLITFTNSEFEVKCIVAHGYKTFGTAEKEFHKIYPKDKYYIQQMIYARDI